MKYYFLRSFLLFFVLFACNNGEKNEKNPLFTPPSFGTDDAAKKSAYMFLIQNMAGLKHVNESGHFLIDLQSVKKEYLIDNINQAFQIASPLENANLISENEFKEFILPYRLNASSVVDWRSKVWNNYGEKSFENLRSEKDLIDKCNKVNDDLKSWFKFKIPDQIEDTMSYSQILKNKSGSCISMTNLAAYTLRALGAPVSVEVVPAWGNMSGGHMWNALVLKDGKSHPFQGAEANLLSYEPLYLVKASNDELSTYRKPAKVYRNVFSIQKESVYYKYNSKMPPMSVTARMIDVTSKYVPVSDIVLDANTLPNAPKLLFINCYNSGTWVPVMGTELKNGKYIFADMPRDLLYQVSTYNEPSLRSVEKLVYLDKDGKVVHLYPDERNPHSIKIKRVKSIEADQMEELKKGWDVKRLEMIAKEEIFSRPLPEKTYHLFCWKNNWVDIGLTKAINGVLNFEAVPSEGLYLISDKAPSVDDRPFIILNGNLKWL